MWCLKIYNNNIRRIKLWFENSNISLQTIGRSIATIKLPYTSPSTVHLPPEDFPILIKADFGNFEPLGPFPPTLKKVCVSYSTNIAKDFPLTITHLKIDRCYNYYTDFTKFSCLTHLKTSNGVNFQKLPPKLETLSAISDFVPLLPNTITQITFDDHFNNSIENLQQLPKLTTVNFGNRFSKDLSYLPSSVKYVTFGNSFAADFFTTLSKDTKLIRISFQNTGAFYQLFDFKYFTAIPALHSITHLLIYGISLWAIILSNNSLFVPPNITHMILNFYGITPKTTPINNVLSKWGVTFEKEPEFNPITGAYEFANCKTRKSSWLGLSFLDWESFFRQLKNGAYTTIYYNDTHNC